MENISCLVWLPARDVLIVIMSFAVGMYTTLILNSWIESKQRAAIERQIMLERLDQVTRG